MKDTIKLYNIYADYLKTTVRLIELVERYDNTQDTTVELGKKYSEFTDHAHALIGRFNEDLHLLLRINQELKGLINGNEKS